LDLAVGTARSPVVVFINQNPVPVELTSFTASQNNNDVQLNWSTATETNNYGFEIQKQVGSRQSSIGNWEEIGFVPGFGTSTEKHFYSFNDENLVEGKYQYRLKQIDFDGSSSYSEIVEVEINSPIQFTLEQNYPNPFNPKTVIGYQLPVSGNVTLKVYDLLGSEVAILVDEYKPAGTYEVEFDESSFSSGTYLYKLTAGEFISTKKMILLK
jgi:hypothetical protein